jgi:methylated-DNA-[protein]-cysteine S-methyltransferase
MIKTHFEQDNVVINVPFGAVGVSMEGHRVIGVKLFQRTQEISASTNQFAQFVVNQFAQYFKQATSSLDISYLLVGTLFQQRVLRAIAEIPVGKVLTYAELADQVDSGPRAVANACGANKLPLLIPCHRVVAKNGMGGFMQGIEGGLKIKEWLLAHESK